MFDSTLYNWRGGNRNCSKIVHKEKRLQNEQRLINVWNNLKSSKKYIIWVPEKEPGVQGRERPENVFEIVMF